MLQLDSSTITDVHSSKSKADPSVHSACVGLSLYSRCASSDQELLVELMGRCAVRDEATHN